MRHVLLTIVAMFAVCCFLNPWPVAAADDAAGAAGPTIIKDSLQITAFTVNKYKGSFDVWSWLPEFTFRVDGPIPSGSQLWVQTKLPTGDFVKFDCPTKEIAKGHWMKTTGGGRAAGEDKGITYTGTVDFTIHIRNELAGTDSVLYTGKFKVAKAHSNENPAETKDHFCYYVDQDWNLPIGYVYTTPDAVEGNKLTTLNVSFWARGDVSGFQPHLFYKGKEIGKIFFEEHEMGAASFKHDVTIEPTHTVDNSLPEQAKWARIVCLFPNVKAVDKTGKTPNILHGQKGERYLLSANPGEYEVKVLWKDKLARDIKFTVRPDGTIDDSMSVANSLNDKHAIVPVQIIGDQDGKWDHDAWKADAFYGNPLKGFTAIE